MYLTAETVTVDDDEGRFTLEIVDDEGDCHSCIIHHIALDAFYDQVKGRIGPYLQERDDARAVYKAPVPRRIFPGDPNENELDNDPVPGTHWWVGEGSSAFTCSPEDVDESGGYEISDPKPPDFPSIHSGIWDARAGK